MLKILWNILKDERGLAPWIIPAAISAGSAILGSLSKKKNYGQLEPYSGYNEMMGQTSRQIGQRVQQPGQLYSGSFEIPQPGIEAQTEQILSRKLGELPTAQSYKEQVEASKTQQIAREKERAASQKSEEAEMYNRLGLVSSTPWMTRAGEIGEESLSRQKDIETGMDIYGLEYGLQADQLAENIANQYLTQARGLGSTQRTSDIFSTGVTYEDWARAQQEPLQWAQLAQGQQPIYQEPEMGWGETLGSAGMDIGSFLLKQQLANQLGLSGTKLG